MTTATAPASDFATALRTFDVSAMRAHLTDHPWPDSLVGLPPWHWVVDNAVARSREVGTLRHPLTLSDLLAGVRAQLDLLNASGQDPQREEISRNQSQGGCLHRLLAMGSIQHPRPDQLAQVAQCILENVPEDVLAVKNEAGLTAEALLGQMGHSPAEHNLSELRRAFAARQAFLRVQQTGEAPQRPRRPRARA